MWRVVLVLSTGLQMFYEEAVFASEDEAVQCRDRTASSLAAGHLVRIGGDMILPNSGVVAVRVEQVEAVKPSGGKPNLLEVPKYH